MGLIFWEGESDIGEPVELSDGASVLVCVDGRPERLVGRIVGRLVGRLVGRFVGRFVGGSIVEGKSEGTVEGRDVV